MNAITRLFIADGLMKISAMPGRGIFGGGMPAMNAPLPGPMRKFNMAPLFSKGRLPNTQNIMANRSPADLHYAMYHPGMPMNPYQSSLLSDQNNNIAQQIKMLRPSQQYGNIGS